MPKDNRALQTVEEKVEEILQTASAMIAELMNRGGDAVTVGHFMAAMIYDLSEEEHEAAVAGSAEPKCTLKFVTNLTEDQQMEFLAQVAEGLQQPGRLETLDVGSRH